MRLRQPDRAAVDRREHEPVEQALLPLGDERAAEAEQRGEEDRHPEQAELGEPRGAGREREVEDDEDRDHEQQHRGQRVAGPQLEPQVLPRQRRRVGRGSYASASLPLASGATRSGSCVATRIVRRSRIPASSRSSSSAPVGVEAAERLVEDQQLGLVQQRAAEREPLQLAARELRRPLAPRLPEAEALEQHPDPLAPLGHAVEPPVEVEVLERGQLAVDERLVAEEADRAALRLDLERARRSGSRARRRAAAASSCPRRSAPVTTRKPPRSSSKSSPRSTRFAP